MKSVSRQGERNVCSEVDWEMVCANTYSCAIGTVFAAICAYQCQSEVKNEKDYSDCS